MAYDGRIRIDTSLDNRGITDGLKALKGEAGKLAAKAGTAIAAGLGLKKMIDMGADFESQMSTVGAISLATADDMEMLNEKAKQMGIDTVFSATEAGKAFEYMAMAGWKTEQMMSGIEGIMNLAAASGEDLGLVSDIVTDAMTAFGLSAEESGHFADVLAAASSNANTNVGMMGDTFKYVAPVAGAMKFSIEDTAVAIGLMANAGIKASQAGTALRQVFTRLAKPPKEAAEAMEALNLSVTNADGSFKPLMEIIEEMRDKFSALTDEQKTMYAAMLGGQEAMSGLLAIVNASEGDISKLSAAIDKADGSAKKMAETKLDNLHGQLTLLGSSAEGLGIAVYEGIENPLKDAVKVGIKSLNELSGEIQSGDLKKSVANIGALLGNGVKLLSQITSSVLPPLVKTLGFIGNNLQTITPLVIGIFGAMKSYTVVLSATKAIGKINTLWKASKVIITEYTAALAVNSATAVTGATVSTLLTSQLTLQDIAVGLLTRKISLATAAQLAWNAVQNANPVGLAIATTAALAGIITAVVIATNKETEAEKALREQNEKLLEDTNERIKAYGELKERQTESVNASLAENEHIKTLADSLMSLADEDGRVTDANKARAEFILNQLNSALGTEYKMTGNQIQNYKDLQSEIYKTIEAKKLEILMSAQEEKYKNAIQNKDKAEADMATAWANGAYALDLIAEKQEKIKEIQEELIALNNDANASDFEITQKGEELVRLNEQIDALKETNKTAIETYNKASEEYKNYANDIITYESASTMALAGQTDAAIDYLSKQNGAFLTASAAKEKYANDSQRALTELGNQYLGSLQATSIAFEQYLKNPSDATLNYLKTALNNLSSAKQEFEKAGGDSAKGFVNSMNGIEISFKPFLDKIKAQEEDFKANGKYIPLGIAQGIEDGKPSAITAAIKMIADILTATRNAAEIKSPSRLFKREVGKYIPLGTAGGITENTNSVVKAAVNMVDKTVDGAAARIIDTKYKLSDAAKQAFDDLDLQLDFGFVGEADYYAEMARLRNEYIKKGTKEWWDYTKKIRDYKIKAYENAIDEYENADDWYYNLKKKLTTLSANDEAYILQQKARRYKKYADDVLSLEGISEEKRAELREKYIKQAENSYIDGYKTVYDSVKKTFDDLTGDIEDNIDDVKKMRDKLAKSFTDKNEFVQKVTFKGAGADGKDEISYLLGDYGKRTDDLMKFNTLAESLKSKIPSKELFNMLVENGLDGIGELEYLDTLSPEKLAEAIEAWSEYRKLSGGVSDNVYGSQISDLEALKENAKQGFSEFVTTIQSGLSEFFGGIPDGFFDIGTESGEEFGDAFKTQFENILNTVKTTFSDIVNSFMPKFVFDANGASLSSGNTTYTANYYIQPSRGESTHQQLKAINNAQSYNKMRGGY